MAGMSYNSNISDFLPYFPSCDLCGWAEICIWQHGPLSEHSHTLNLMCQAPITSPQKAGAKLRIWEGLRLEHKQLAASVLPNHLYWVSKWAGVSPRLGRVSNSPCSFPIKELSLSHSNQSIALLALWDLSFMTEQAVCRAASALARGSFRKACCSLSEIAGHLLRLARFTGSHSCGWKEASFVYCISSTETKLANVQLHQKILPC